MVTFIAQNLIYCPDYFEKKSEELTDEIMVPIHCFNELLEQFNDQEVLFVTIRNMRNGKSYIVTIGVSPNAEHNIIYVPEWILTILEYNNDPLILDTVHTVDIPIATKIIIKPQDSYAFDIDIRECVERAIMNLHSIRERCVIPITDIDVELMIYIQSVEPSSISRIVAGEVEVEFINTFFEPVEYVEPVEPVISLPKIPSIPSMIQIPTDDSIEYPIEYQAPPVPRASSLSICQAWDYHVEEEKSRYIREARMKRFH